MGLLKGVRVLDMARLVPGPLATMLMADMGADVIKIEEPGVGDYMRTGVNAGKMDDFMRWFLCFNRNKRSIGVDFRTQEGRDIIYRLAETADAVVESGRPGMLERLGLGYQQLRTVNPRIVYCSITGFGQTGPFANLATHGGAFDAVTGLAPPYPLEDGSFAHMPDGPLYPRGGTYAGWVAALGICAALVQARSSGEGACLDISCADSTLMAVSKELLSALNPETVNRSAGDGSPSAKGSYYQTRDGRFMLLQSLEQHFWENFCNVVGRPDLADRGDWNGGRMDRSADDALRGELVGLFRTKTQDEWIRLFLENNIAGAPYYPIDEIESTELFAARNMIIEQEHPQAGTFKMIGNAVKVAGEIPEAPRYAPELGQHTGELLEEIGYSQEKVRQLRSSGIVV